MKPKTQKPLTFKQRTDRLMGRVMQLIILLIPPAFAFADSLTTILQNGLNYLTGTVGVIIATLAIVGAGFLCFGGKGVPKILFFSILLGVAIIFGASAVMNALYPAGS